MLFYRTHMKKTKCQVASVLNVRFSDIEANRIKAAYKAINSIIGVKRPKEALHNRYTSNRGRRG